SGPAEVKRARLVFSTRGRSRNLAGWFSKGTARACRDVEPRNVLLRELFFHLARQPSLSLTPPSAWRKSQFSRRASCYHNVNRSGHVLSFACDGHPFPFFMAST